MIYAVERGDKNLINTLLNSGANINQTVSASNGASWCPICTAVNYGDLEMVKFLVEEKNADLNSICQVRDYVQNSTYSLIQFSESGNCWRKNKNVTEYLLLAPTIQKKKTEEKNNKIQEYISRGSNYLQKDDLINAKKEFDNAYSLNQNPNDKYELRVLKHYFEKSDFDKVLSLINSFNDNTNLNFLLYKAYAFIDLKKEENAIEILNKCNQLSPNNYSVLLGYADYYSKLDNTEKVYDYIKKVFEISNPFAFE